MIRIHPSIAVAGITGVTALLLTGCGGVQSATSSAPVTVPLTGIHGRAYGGQQPIAGSTIQLWQAGTTGYGQGAQQLISSTVLTDANGNFNITGLYHCTSGSQVYITATGGDPSPATPNGAANLVAGLGLCDNLSSANFITINELTTVGTVWALAPFMNGMNIGSSPTNQSGMAAAFGDIATLVNTSNGAAQTSTANVTIPTAKLNTIANAIAGCINSTGLSSMGCSTLMDAAPNPDGSTPTDTITAALNMQRHPSRNVPTIVGNASTTPPFQPILSSLPDLTIAVTFSGGGIDYPSNAAIDAQGNVWITSFNNRTVTEMSHTGTFLTGANGYTNGYFNTPIGVAIDTSGDAWILDEGDSNITELNASRVNVGNSPFSGGGLNSPNLMAFDLFGNAWVTNGQGVSAFSSTGVPLSGSNGFKPTGLNHPYAIAVNPR